MKHQDKEHVEMGTLRCVCNIRRSDRVINTEILVSGGVRISLEKRVKHFGIVWTLGKTRHWRKCVLYVSDFEAPRRWRPRR